MIKIKDYILNENDISYIVGNTDDDRELKIQWKDNTSTYIKASFDDIEWNYGTPQETQRKIQKELCKSCYYRDSISNEVERLEKNNKIFEDANFDLNRKIEQLEEENETLKELNVCVGCDNNPDYKSRIDKAIEYINNTQFYSIRSNSKTLFKEYLENIEKLLKGE